MSIIVNLTQKKKKSLFFLIKQIYIIFFSYVIIKIFIGVLIVSSNNLYYPLILLFNYICVCFTFPSFVSNAHGGHIFFPFSTLPIE